MENNNYNHIVSNRIAQLRHQKGISGKEMSNCLDKNANYIRSIERMIISPSMEVFFQILEFLDVTPVEFFDIVNYDPISNRDMMRVINQLDPEDRKHICAICERLASKK